MVKLKLDLVCQVAVVVRNLEEGLREFRKLFGFDENTLSYSNSIDAYREGRLKEVRYEGIEGEYGYTQYNFFMGGMDIEMFAPIDGLASPFADFLVENGGPGVHHLNIHMANREEGISCLKNELEIKPFFDLYHLGRACTYFDLRDKLGLVIEIGSRVVGPRATYPEEEIQKLISYRQ